jgi:hypothetical protein
MRKTISLLLLFLPFTILTAQFKVNDTLFFVREKKDSSYHRIFIDPNKNSHFYSQVSDFKISGFDSDTYKQTLNYLYSQKLFPKKQSLNDIPTEWVMLETYKGTVYVYSPCDFYYHYKVKITDSTFIDWTGEGPEATYIQKFRKIDSFTFYFLLKSQFFSSRELTIKYINKEKGIAIFRSKFYNLLLNKSEERYQLMGDVKKIRNIPLLVNYCDYQKESELDFDQVNYATKFNNKK